MTDLGSGMSAGSTMGLHLFSGHVLGAGVCVHT